MSAEWLHAGSAGVLLFFLVSGYIVPASIERRGNVRDFWIGRVFRLYPAFLVTIAIAALLALIGPGWVPESLSEQPATSVLADFDPSLIVAVTLGFSGSRMSMRMPSPMQAPAAMPFSG